MKSLLSIITLCLFAVLLVIYFRLQRNSPVAARLYFIYSLISFALYWVIQLLP